MNLKLKWPKRKNVLTKEMLEYVLVTRISIKVFIGIKIMSLFNIKLF